MYVGAVANVWQHYTRRQISKDSIQSLKKKIKKNLIIIIFNFKLEIVCWVAEVLGLLFIKQLGVRTISWEESQMHVHK